MPYQKLARDFLAVTNKLVDIWMDRKSSAAGHLYIGVTLTEAYYSRNQWVSAQHIVNQMDVYSVDTIRRRLEEMVDRGLVEVAEFDTKKVYRAVPKAAEATLKAYQHLVGSKRNLRSESHSAAVN